MVSQTSIYLNNLIQLGYNTFRMYFVRLFTIRSKMLPTEGDLKVLPTKVARDFELVQQCINPTENLY